MYNVSLSKFPAFNYRLCLGVKTTELINFLMIQVRLAIRVRRIAEESKQTSPRIYIVLGISRVKSIFGSFYLYDFILL